MDEHGIQHLLQPGEYLLWQGTPASGVRLQKSDVFMGRFFTRARKLSRTA